MQHRASTERLAELDAAKFLAMVAMVTGHVLDALVRSDQLDINRFPWSLWHWWRGITAPIFLTISGILFALTMQRNKQGVIEAGILRRRVLRAAQLLAIGYLLVFPANRIFDLPFVEDQVLQAFFQVNILQLVAVSLLLLVVIALLFPNPGAFRYATLGTGIGISLLTPFVHSIPWYEQIPAPLAAYVSYEGGSLFPIFPFSAYMALGAWIGTLLVDVQTSRVVWLRRFCFAAGGALVVGGAAMSLLLSLPQVDLYRYTPMGVAIRQGTALLFIGGVSLLMPLLRSVQSLLALFGKQALTIYVLHLVLLFGTPWFSSIGRWYPKALSLEEGIAAAGVILGITLGSVLAYQWIRPLLVRPPVLRLVRIGVAGAIAYLLLA
ncbi:MAG: heparan-alpha-glucosaminide N-acetyltransferase domain-containing protein [Bacteroidota bacterium]|nr:heparan-alpha-glucosaminide N-acetyltransferase domain-containing protein [Bacteroidota bacterium]